MKQQQWQQQQQSGGSVSPSGAGSVPAAQQQHRSMYQPMGPHHQHLASMGFDPRWLMMQSYMDPRMMSGRPPMDMPTNIHPGTQFNGEGTISTRWLLNKSILQSSNVPVFSVETFFYAFQGGCLRSRLCAESLETTPAPALIPLTT